MLRICVRYLLSKSSHSVVNLISRVSLWAIATPVAAVIILLSVFNGFGDIVEQMSSSLDSDLTLESSRGQVFQVEQLDTAAIRAIDGVRAISLGAEQTVLLRRASREKIITLRGVEPSYGDVTLYGQSITLGDARTQWGDYDRLLLGNSAAYELGLNSIRGSEISVYALRRKPITSILPMASYSQRTIDVGGLFTLDMESEGEYALTSLRFAQDIMRLDRAATHLFIGVEDGFDIERVKRSVEAIAGEEFRVRDKFELNPTLYSIVKGEKRAIMLIALFVMILASFTLIGALIMQILDKRSEFTPLRAMGASTSYIRCIFIGCGVLLSLVATLIGGAVGLVVALLQQYFEFVKIPASGFILDAYPVRVAFGDVALVVFASIIISTLLSVAVVRLTIAKM